MYAFKKEQVKYPVYKVTVQETQNDKLFTAYSFVSCMQVEGGGRRGHNVTPLIKFLSIWQIANRFQTVWCHTCTERQFHNRNKQALPTALQKVTSSLSSQKLFLPHSEHLASILIKYSPAWPPGLLDHWESHWDLAYLPFLAYLQA